MAYSTEYTLDGLGVIHRGEGIVTGADVIAASADHHRLEDRARRLRYGIVDFTEVTELRVSAAEAQAIADEDRLTAALTPDVVVAVVAPQDHVFGMSRMWETLAESTGWTTRVFRDRAEAVGWLREQFPNAVG